MVKLLCYLLRRFAPRNAQALIVEALSTVGALPLHSIIRVDDAGKLLIRGRAIEYEQAVLLRESARNVLLSPAWQLVHEQALYAGVSEGFLKAQSEKQMLFGQAAVWFGQQEKDLLSVLAGEVGNSPLSGD